MEKKKIIRSKKEIELLEFVPEQYLISEKANNILKQLREGVSSWVSDEKYREVNISIWVYEDDHFNAFCYCIDGQNYIALSIGLFFAFWREVNEFIDQENLSLVFKLSEEKKHVT